ncbi:unnamed protein product [Didymodactylos carnosus]|uniref:PI-PLC Y-box domain-containing protein n=1 Tax=Didymodactylos carnosus TaxID=1234261 RepID=A0A815CWM7_9BILA|nr:unnamed protein product [Didymodactylos carnosus]CAF1290013.1 unnamed protein product [Didymodactylos carnosus]CAF3659026.1 unnamed protein product [Didymodactylos carnosus]CAF4095123.1 unnamed protein product [Didymodactylos carnosus]
METANCSKRSTSIRQSILSSSLQITFTKLNKEKRKESLQRQRKISPLNKSLPDLKELPSVKSNNSSAWLYNSDESIIIKQKKEQERQRRKGRFYLKKPLRCCGYLITPFLCGVFTLLTVLGLLVVGTIIGTIVILIQEREPTQITSATTTVVTFTSMISTSAATTTIITTTNTGTTATATVLTFASMASTSAATTTVIPTTSAATTTVTPTTSAATTTVIPTTSAATTTVILTTSAATTTVIPTTSAATTTVIATTMTDTTATTTYYPPECSNYTTVNDPTRNINYTATNTSCDNTFFSYAVAKWVRFVGTGGTVVPTYSIPVNHCGGYGTMWFNGTYSSTVYGTQNSLICVTWGLVPCYQSGYIFITNCNTYYVYAVRGPIYCARYCTL